jgi:predicted transposase YbfD/YdcC
MDDEISTFPQARQLVSLTRHWTNTKTGKPGAETRIFITSLEVGEKSPGRLAEIGREHWSIENKNHWKRDASRWREDRSPRRTGRGARNLALMRGALLALIDQSKFGSLNAALDHYASYPRQALRLLNQNTRIPD